MNRNRIFLFVFLCALASAGVSELPAQAAPAQTPRAAPPGPMLAPGESLDDVVARIDGHPITRRELLAQAQLMRLQTVNQGGVDPARDPEYLAKVLDALVGEYLLYTDTVNRGAGASDQEVEAQLDAVLANEDPAKLAAHGVDREALRRQLRQNLTIRKVMFSEIAPRIQIPEAALQAYYEQNRDKMRVPEQYKVRHIFLPLPPGAEPAAVTAARARLEDLRKQIEGGADFAELARQHSGDPKSRERGGELPWLIPTGKGGAFEAAIKKLARGGLSPVVETETGLHLIELQGRRAERVRPFEEVRGEIAQRLGMLMARREVQRRVAELRSKAKVEILLQG